MNRNVRFLFSAALAMSSAAAFADGEPVVPTVKFADCINGNLCITLDTTVNPSNVLFQVKSLDFPGSDWRTVRFAYKSAQISMKDFYSYYWAVDYPGETLVRVAETNAAGRDARGGNACPCAMLDSGRDTRTCSAEPAEIQAVTSPI